jgi:PAS domain S-box-containing protein
MPRKLYLQVVLLLSSGLVAMVVAFGWWVGRTQGDALVEETSAHAVVLAKAHADSAAHFLVVEEYAALEELLLQAARLPDVVGIQLHELDGTLLIDIRGEPEGSEPRLRYPDAPVREAAPASSEPFVRKEGHHLVVWVPISNGKVLGWLETTHSLRDAEAIRASIWRQTIVLGSVWALVGVLIVTLVLRRPMGAIRQLSVFARELARRKGERISVRSRADEIVHLADALDHASVELADADRQLMTERERLSVTLQSLGEGVIACDRDRRVTLMNEAAEALTGWSASEAVGRPLEDVFRLIDEQTRELVPSALQGATHAVRVLDPSGREVLLGRDDDVRHVSGSCAPIIDGSGEAIGAVIVFRDESERLAAEAQRRDLEAQLLQAQKMEAVGHLAGGIAHDFNNILTGIIGDASLVVEETAAGDPRRDSAQEILDAARRAATLTRGLLAFSRKQRIEPRPADLNEIVGRVERMLRRIIGEDVELRVQLSARPLVASVDPAQIEQVLMNLATNAKDAMPAGGLLGIATGESEVEPEGHGDGTRLSGPVALLTVSDSGAGMSEEVQERIFEPFFTTKEAGKGTGLGLAIVLGIVQQHGGIVRVYSRAGIGTTFKVYLPLADAASAGEVPASAQDPSLRRGEERILLVEDELDVRRVVRAALQRAGHAVVEAANGVDALEVLQRGGEPFDLVISDVIMPRMNGRELHRELGQRHPGLPVLFISGYAFDVIRHRALLDDGVDLLMKPFTPRALLARVRELLERSRSVPKPDAAEGRERGAAERSRASMPRRS